jgi:hypothetical protein
VRDGDERVRAIRRRRSRVNATAAMITILKRGERPRRSRSVGASPQRALSRWRDEGN